MRQTGITKETVKNLVIDSGAVYKDYGLGTQALLGATRDGNTFLVTQDVKRMTIDGQKGPIKGARRIIDVVAQITANILEFSKEILVDAFPGSTLSGDATHHIISRSRQNIESGLAGESGDDYITNIAIVGEVSGSGEPVICMIDNAICDGNVELNLVDQEEGVTALQFTGHFDPAVSLDNEPWNVKYPKINIES